MNATTIVTVTDGTFRGTPFTAEVDHAKLGFEQPEVQFLATELIIQQLVHHRSILLKGNPITTEIVVQFFKEQLAKDPAIAATNVLIESINSDEPDTLDWEQVKKGIENNPLVPGFKLKSKDFKGLLEFQRLKLAALEAKRGETKKVKGSEHL